MKFLLRLIFNKFILSLLILFFFAIDFSFVTLEPFRYYDFERPTEEATAYYEVELGEAKVYVQITYQNDRVYLVPTNNEPTSTMIEKQTVVSWYYYAGAIVLVNILPIGMFFKSKKKNKDK